MPQVSVIIPAFNAARFIPEALDSVFNQSFRDFEVIVVDDGSTDNTKEVVSALQGKEDVRYFYQTNGGQSSARNRAMREARGKFLAFLDADDLWMPEFLEKMVVKMDEGFDWSVSDNFRDEINVQTGHVKREIERRDIYDEWDIESLLREFLREDRVGSPGKVMLRRSVLMEKGICFDSKTDNREDWDISITLLEKGCRPGWVHEPLFVYRIRTDSSNITRKKRWKTLYSTFFLLEKHSETYLGNKMHAVLADHYFRLARRFWNEWRDINKITQCIFRNVQYKGWGDMLSLIGRKWRIQ